MNVKPALLATILFAPLLVSAHGQAEQVMTGNDFIANFRTMRGATVVISDCRIGGTTSYFIRCETANRSASYTLEAETMNPTHFKWVLENCPTGSVEKLGCKIRVQGVVTKRSNPPSLDAAEILGFSG